jgi:hypothetical protein
MNGSKALAVAPDLELDAWLEPFESAAEEGTAPEIADFLPDRSHPKYGAVLRELVRIDLEFAWARGEDRRIEDYVKRFPALLTDPAALADVALEEYRQRRAAGEDPDPAESTSGLASSCRRTRGSLLRRRGSGTGRDSPIWATSSGRATGCCPNWAAARSAVSISPNRRTWPIARWRSRSRRD